MRLVPCSPPSEPLVNAPCTALVRDADPAAEWNGFWSRSSDAYYARLTTPAGAIEWFRMDDDAFVDDDAVVGAQAATRVLPFRSDAMRRVTLIVAASPGGRQMLVGTARRALRQ